MTSGRETHSRSGESRRNTTPARDSAMPTLKLEPKRSQAFLAELGALIRDVPYPQVPRAEPSLADILIRGAQGLDGTADLLEPSSVLAQVFFQGKALPVGELRKALGTVSIEDLERMGLVKTSGQRTHAVFRIGSLDGHLIISDWQSWRAEQTFVPGINPSGVTLSHFIPKRPAGKALDLGTGSGLIAVLCAEWAECVVATDISPRALELARASAWLNGIAKLDLRLGSWFDPVQGELFDLVMCNPPYVISPERRFIYRDGTEAGNAGDLCARLIGGLPAILAPGGIGIVLVNWGRRFGEDDFSEPRRWFEERNLAGVILSYRQYTPEQYAWWWQLSPTGFPADAADRVRRWVDYYDHLGIEAIHSGVIALRQPSDLTRRCDTVTATFAANSPGEASPEQLMAMWDAAENVLEGDVQILAAVPRFTGPHDALQGLRFRDGSYSAEPVRFSWPEGVGVEAAVDARMLQLVLSIDNRRSVRELVISSWPETSGSATALHEICATMVELRRAGLVELVEAAT